MAEHKLSKSVAGVAWILASDVTPLNTFSHTATHQALHVLVFALARALALQYCKRYVRNGWSVGPSRKGTTQSAHSRFGKAMARTRARQGPNGICPATRSRVCPYILAPAVSDSQSEGQPEKSSPPVAGPSSPPVAGPSSSVSCSGCEVLSM